MQIIGFNLTKISAEKSPDFKKDKKVSTNTDIEFMDVVKEDLPLSKELEAIRVVFKLSVDYLDSESKIDSKLGSVSVEGNVVFSSTKEESKDITKHWKKKEMSAGLKASLFNFVLKESCPRIVELQKDLALPSPFLRIPQLKLESK